MKHVSELDSREILSEIRGLINTIDLKIITADTRASPFAKNVAVQELFRDHRVEVQRKQHWR